MALPDIPNRVACTEPRKPLVVAMTSEDLVQPADAPPELVTPSTDSMASSMAAAISSRPSVDGSTGSAVSNVGHWVTTCPGSASLAKGSAGL